MFRALYWSLYVLSTFAKKPSNTYYCPIFSLLIKYVLSILIVITRRVVFTSAFSEHMNIENEEKLLIYYWYMANHMDTELLHWIPPTFIAKELPLHHSDNFILTFFLPFPAPANPGMKFAFIHPLPLCWYNLRSTIPSSQQFKQCKLMYFIQWSIYINLSIEWPCSHSLSCNNSSAHSNPLLVGASLALAQAACWKTEFSFTQYSIFIR